MIFLATNFHYIHEENRYPFPGIHPTTPKQFANQLDEIGQYFKFISQDDLVLAIDGKKKLPERCCLITFDDGLKSQYENALPLLKRKGIPAVFFMNSLPLKERKVCLVHKIHWLRANLGSKSFSEKLDQNLKFFSNKLLSDFSVQDNVAKNQYPYDDLRTAKFKFILNNIIPRDLREKSVKPIFKEEVINESDFCKMFYMSTEQVKEIATLGFLGIHSFSHKPLSQLKIEEAKQEIQKDIQAFHNFILNKKIYGISYPYGGFPAVNIKVARLVESLGIKFGLTTERAFNQSLEEPFLFARMETNNVVGGKTPGFRFIDNKLKILQGVTRSRQVYFKEKIL